MDPITFSIIRHRLYRVVDEAVITLKHVSGSAITNEGHDLMVSLYRADGSLLMGGVGFLHHLTSASEACKHIIRRFAGNIRVGDVFMLNDPYTAALHTSDVYLVSPIHYDGKLVAWSACFVHVYDIGALNPGGFSPDSRDIYTEGFSTQGVKIVDRGEMRRDVLDTLLNMVRAPEMVALDISSLIACNNVAKDRMLALIRKYGPETFEDACAALIEQSENLMRERLRELPNGSWQSRQYLDAVDETYEVRLTMTKKDDTLTFDFAGSSPQSKYGVNCSYWAGLGGLFAPLFPTLCHDITWNDGVIRPIKMVAPEGSIVNATRPAPVSIATVAAIQSVNNAAFTCISKMLSASEKYKNEATAVWHANHFAIFMFGPNQRKSYSIGILTETFAGSGGGRAFADGVDVGGEMPNPISRMANVETIEGTFPIRYLFRRRMKDSGGAGMFRGGTGCEAAITPHDAPDGGINYVISGKGNKYPMSDGLGGGLPGGTNDYRWVRVNETKKQRRNLNPLAQTLAELPGDKQEVTWGVYPLMGEDVLYWRWDGGGGYGDPLERDPAQVLADIRNGVVTERAARDLYGVAIARGGEAVDLQKTEVLRRNIRAQRVGGVRKPAASRGARKPTGKKRAARNGRAMRSAAE
jgi:N-methylhydantoinase B